MKNLMMSIAFGCALTAPLEAAPIEFRYGLDVFTESQGTLDALQSISVMREIRPGLHFGQTLYSAAAGDAGGLFIGGFELLKRLPIGRGLELEFGGFIGGGGGAALVAGDGLMTRGHVTLRKHLFGNIAGTLGFSYIDISGSPVSTPALNFGLSRDTDFAFASGYVEGGVSSGRVIRAIKPLVKQFHPQSNLRRNGTPLGTMTLIGFEASFASSPEALNETFIQATGAVSGDGEGYADIQLVIGGKLQQPACVPLPRSPQALAAVVMLTPVAAFLSVRVAVWHCHCLVGLKLKSVRKQRQQSMVILPPLHHIFAHL